MTSAWTTERILALAPDASAAKAGRGLATPRPWLSLGRAEGVIWGECQGSGKDPYQTQVDLSEPAFRCSCPSRKFPCKHGLGLFLLLDAQPGAFAAAAPPAWVSAWLAARAQRAVQKVERAERGGEVADPAAQAKRAEQRRQKTAAGLDELDRWVADLIRTGLATAQGRPHAFWEGMAARLVDAQCPGAARLVRELATVAASGEGWPERLLDRLASLHLLIEGFRRLDALPPETQADVRAALGWPQTQDELLAGPGLRDRWAVVAQRLEEEDRLRVQRSWLLGGASGRPALVLHFAAPGQPLDTSLVPGLALDAELVFYPSGAPLRALVRSRDGAPAPLDGLGGHATAAAALAAYGAALARSPWLDRYPLPLRGVLPLSDEGGWSLRDGEGGLLPLAAGGARLWRLLAVSGGRPVDVFGEWDGERLTPATVWAHGHFVVL